jgi:hypothetical protein
MAIAFEINHLGKFVATNYIENNIHGPSEQSRQQFKKVAIFDRSQITKLPTKCRFLSACRDPVDLFFADFSADAQKFV